MRINRLALIVALLPLSPVSAQIWAQPGHPEAGFNTGEAPAAPLAGRMTSLGGSGATGPDSVGILPQRDTDFDRKTWNDTPFTLVLALLEALPDRIDSAAQHRLTRNLLVSIGDTPPGDDGGTQMLEQRVRKLLAMGNVADAAALARAAPGLPHDENLARLEIEAELLAGQIEAACIDLRAFAQLLTDSASANGLLLCRQRAGEPLSGGTAPIDSASLGALARIAGAPAAADPVSSPPARLVAAARDSQLPAEQRLEAAFAAGRASAIGGEALMKIFRAAPGAADPLSADGEAPSDGANAAGLFQAIDKEGDTGPKLSMAEKGLLSRDGTTDEIGVAMVEPLRNLQPVAEMAQFANRLAILFYTLGDVEAATPWAELAEQSGSGAALWPYRMLLKQADPTGIAEWSQQAALSPARRGRIMTILSAFGVIAPPPPTTAVAGDDQPEPSFSEILAMDEAATNFRVGETVLRAVAVLGRAGPAHAHPLALRRALADLDAARLHDEAHALAFEAITATLRGR
jgi:hypothetical protein